MRASFLAAAGVRCLLLTVATPLLAAPAAPPEAPAVRGSPRVTRTEDSPQAAKTDTGASSYAIGVGDLLAIHVWKDPDLSRQSVMVRPDGRISLPLVGDIQAAGLGPAVLSSTITEKLKEYVTNPHVTVIVETINSYRVYILGHVLKSGVYLFQSPTRLVEALASAGGFDQFADTSHIVVLSSRGTGGQTRTEVEYKKIVSGARLDDNIYLRPGDTIIVP